MKCPVCKKEDLVALETDGVEVDWCGACKGIWLDRGELELLQGDVQGAAEFIKSLKPAQTPVEKSRRCPICNIRMVKVESAWDSMIVLDRCPRQDGLWLDRGELGKILQVREKTDRVQKYLTGIFGNQ
jgi:hypothetical protein